MINPEFAKYEKILGMDIAFLLELKKKLAIMNIDIADILTFLDRDKVQLFAEQRSDIKILRKKIEDIASAIFKALDIPGEKNEKLND